jgi:hypothetical protein
MKRTQLIAAAVIGLCASSWPASADDKATIDGFLYSKLSSIGTRSETPHYFLQTPGGEKDVAVESRAQPYLDDPTLRQFLGTKVTVTGEMKGQVLSYDSIKKCDATLWCKIWH